MKRFLLLLLALVLIGAGAGAWYAYAWTAPGPSPADKIVMVAPGTGLPRIAQQLEDAGTISWRRLFQLELRLRGQDGQLKAGEYEIPAHASMADIAAILIAGKSIQHRLTAAEGLTSDMIWKLVRDDKVLVGDPGPVPAEGTLLPETYLFTRGMTRGALLKQMAAAQRKFIDEHWPNRTPDLPYGTPEQAVILASIVEKETGVASERPRVAAVFVNRLRQGMRLQSDPTIIYGLTRGYPLGRGIRQSELEGATPYNTYAIDGLPPGPIANPGKDALAAVMNPPATNELYFVADGQGRSVFSSGLTEHGRNVQALRATERRQLLMKEPVRVDTAPFARSIPSLPGQRRN
jgi:UPF0755 protein